VFSFATVTVLEVIQRSTEFLQQRGVDAPRLQVELILAHVLKVPRLKLYLNFERPLAELELVQVREMVKRRGAREPLQHIVGTTSFCGLEIKCSSAALVPRPETELLAERAWQFAGNRGKDALVLDVGAGTGCIAIAVASHATDAVVDAVDVSAEALALARENVAAHGLAERVRLRLGDAFTSESAAMRYDVIVSNPPYIPREEIPSLEPEVRSFDPHLALDGGIDGLEFYRRIATHAGKFLKDGGRVMLEFGDGQANEVKKIFESQNWIVEEIVADYSARPRILIARQRT
jgi:release factor glutamine methyltransferase